MKSDDDGLKQALHDAASGLGLTPVGTARRAAGTAGGGRRARRGRGGRPLHVLAMVRDEDGVLHWEERPPGAPVESVVRGRLPRAGGRRAAGEAGGGTVTAFEFERLEPSEITRHLDDLDLKLTPARGLRRWTDGRLVPVTGPGAAQRVLLLVHGTFSHGEVLVDDLGKSDAGRGFLKSAARQYDAILTFDHPTLAVSPLLNALDLERALAGSTATFDVVAHSRGGLVTRWWAERVRGGRNVGKLVMVGAPLAGTSLAAPPRLREALDYLANVGEALRTLLGLGAANPFLAVSAGLLQIVTSLTALAARTPLLDAAVAMIPGLAAQSRVGNNPEVLRLREDARPVGNRLYAVRANFEPGPVGWAFWKLFVRPGERIADLGADLLFPGPNDLVVDTESITSVADGVNVPSGQVLDFGTTDRVHHCNYFAQPETADRLGQWLLPG